MNKSALIAAVAGATTLTKANAAKAVDAVFQSIVGAMQAGDEVRVAGFGSFRVTNRAASKGRNPRTGQEIPIKAMKVPRFAAGKSLKDAVNR